MAWHVPDSPPPRFSPHSTLHSTYVQFIRYAYLVCMIADGRIGVVRSHFRKLTVAKLQRKFVSCRELVLRITSIVPSLRSANEIEPNTLRESRWTPELTERVGRGEEGRVGQERCGTSIYGCPRGDKPARAYVGNYLS